MQRYFNTSWTQFKQTYKENNNLTLKKYKAMTPEEKEKYLEAVDLVCINCIYKTGDECYTCLVRKSVDYHRFNL